PPRADDRRAVATRPDAQLPAVRAFVLWPAPLPTLPTKRADGGRFTSARAHEEPARRRRGGRDACVASASARRLNAANSLPPAPGPGRWSQATRASRYAPDRSPRGRWCKPRAGG